MANALFVIDSVIIVAGAFYFGVDKAIYATAAVFVSSKVMDAILSGMTQSKQILVISKKWQDIAEEIMTSLNRGVTQIKAKGVYSGQERPVSVSYTHLDVYKRQVLERSSDRSHEMLRLL